MTTSSRVDKQQTGIRERNRIALYEIEFKEKQFMEDEAQYYKTLKTKPRKKTHSDPMLRSKRGIVQRNDA